jgi:putative acetyltransferase
MLLNGEQEAAEMYPAESNHHLPIQDLLAPDVLFYVGRESCGTAVATAALKLYGDWAEVKRVWVEPVARGRGYSRLLVSVLESEARARGIRCLRLETGVDSAAALKLYESAGFRIRTRFADYRPDPLSVFMEKYLLPDQA